MALTSWSTANYLNSTNMPVTAYPFLVSAWFNRSSTDANNRTMVGFSLNSDVNVFWQLRYSGSGNYFQAGSGGTGATFSAATVSGLPATGGWNHYAGVFTAANSRAGWINAAGKVTDTGSITTTVDVYRLGNPTNLTPLASADGMGEISIWDGTGFTTGNHDSLVSKLFNGGAAAAGGNPLNITAEASQPWTGKLRQYLTLTNTSTLTDASGNGKNVSMTGTLTNFASHPTIEAVSAGGELMGQACL